MPKYENNQHTKGANIIEILDVSVKKIRVDPKQILRIENIFAENRRIKGNLKKIPKELVEQINCKNKAQHKPKKRLSPKQTHVKKFAKQCFRQHYQQQIKIETII
jgi:hypothetical protein